MSAVQDPQGHHLLVHQQLKDQFSSVYLTLLSVIQGVALADLALVVGTNYQQFTLTQWLLVLVAFGFVITAWNQYTMHIISLNWISDVRDALLPFVLGALELFFNHLIPLSMGGWLFVGALISSWAGSPPDTPRGEQRKKPRTSPCSTTWGDDCVCSDSHFLGAVPAFCC